MQAGDLTATTTGDVEKDGDVLVLKRIRVVYHLRGDVDREKVERAHAAHASSCPVALSLEGAIDISTELEYVD